MAENAEAGGNTWIGEKLGMGSFAASPVDCAAFLPVVFGCSVCSVVLTHQPFSNLLTPSSRDHITMVSAWRSGIALLPVVAAIRTGVPQTGSTQQQQQPVHSKSFLQPIVARSPSSKDGGVWGTCMCIGRRSPEAAAAVERGDDINVDDNGSSNGRVGDVGGPFQCRDAGVSRWWEKRRVLPALPLVLSATTACSQASIAAVTGGRIGGGYTPPAAERTPSAPPMQQEQRYQAPQRQQQYQPRAGRDIYGSEGSRFHITFDGGRMGRRSNRVRFDPDAGDVPSTSITPGDVAMVGGVSAAVAAVQRYNRRRFLEEEGRGDGRRRSPTLAGRADRKGGKQTAVVSTLQLSLWCDRTGGLGDVLATLDNLSQTADVNSPRGLSTLINEVWLAHRPSTLGPRGRVCRAEYG